MRWVSHPFALIMGVAVSCAGGQSGDPGAQGGAGGLLPVDGGETGGKPNSSGAGGNGAVPTGGAGTGALGPGGSSGAVGGTGGSGGTVGVDCTFVVWQLPDSPRLEYRCAPIAEGWQCMCAGSPASGTAPSCNEALRTLCAVDPNAPGRRFCETPVGTCWPAPASNQSWTCRCGGSATLIDQQAPDCLRAAADACIAPCEGAHGNCAPAGIDSFACDCFYYGTTRMLITPVCAEALAACAPQATGCNRFDGFCTSNSSADGFDCRCLDGSAHQVPYLPPGAGGRPAIGCDQALDMTCAGDNQTACDAETAAARAHCEVDRAADAGAYGFSCTCEALPDSGLSSGTGFASGTTCEEAIAETCPAAIGP